MSVSHVAGFAGAVSSAATGGFISGVLLTAAIAGVIALVVLYRAKRRGTTKYELVLAQSQSSSYSKIYKPKLDCVAVLRFSDGMHVQVNSFI